MPMPDMTQAMLTANPKLIETWLEMMNDGAAFVSERLQKDHETQKALLNSTTPGELMKVQADFFKDAFEQYTEQTVRMFEKMQEVAKQSMGDAAHLPARKYDDVPL